MTPAKTLSTCHRLCNPATQTDYFAITERDRDRETERTATKAKNLAGKQSHNVCMCVWGKNTTYRREMK
jgi:hypothetical protein